MKKLTALILSSLLAAACASRPAASTAPQPSTSASSSGSAGSSATGATGATDARGAVLSFLTAGKEQDLQALSAVWGSAEGSVRTTNTFSREELEKRELIMMCYLDHETHEILSDAPAANNERVIAAQLRRGPLTRTANFYAVAGPGGRWYVRSFDMEVLTPFCSRRSR